MMSSAENARRCARVCGGGHKVVMHTTKRSKSTEIAPRVLADAAKVREHRGEMHQHDERVGLDVWECQRVHRVGARVWTSAVNTCAQVIWGMF